MRIRPPPFSYGTIGADRYKRCCKVCLPQRNNLRMIGRWWNFGYGIPEGCSTTLWNSMCPKTGNFLSIFGKLYATNKWKMLVFRKLFLVTGMRIKWILILSMRNINTSSINTLSVGKCQYSSSLKKLLLKKKALTTVQICKLENIKHESMK